MDEKNGWRLSMAVSAVLALALVWLWWLMNAYQVNPVQLVNKASAEAYLKHHWHHPQTPGGKAWVQIPTGVYIASLKFLNSSEVSVSGYVWQHYKDNLPAGIVPKMGQAGFFLPDQVQAGSDIAPQEVYRVRQGNQVVIGWHFEATLRQPFHYLAYPFDHKTVWVRLWPRNFFTHVILVPDYKAYPATGLKNIFGIAKNIVLGPWDAENAYFGYKPTCYDTTFGVKNYASDQGYPELYFNFVLKRKWSNAFVLYLLPLFLVASLLFAALLTVTRKPELASAHGFSTSGVLGTCSALFFVVVLAHIQLRDQFAGARVVYLELFYFLMYGMLVAVAVNTYLFSRQAFPSFKFLHYKDNLIPKLLFWPLLLLGMVLITAGVQFVVETSGHGTSQRCLQPKHISRTAQAPRPGRGASGS